MKLSSSRLGTQNCLTGTIAIKKCTPRHKIVIAGNHEITFDLEEEKNLSRRFFGAEEIPGGFSKVKDILMSCPGIIYLEDTAVTI